MYTFFIGYFIVLIIWFTIYFKSGYSIFEWAFLGNLLFSLVVAAVVGLLMMLFVGLFLPKEYIIDKSKTIYLESIKDNSSINGDFLLGSGTISNEMYYVFYKKVDDYYSFDKIKAEDAIIKYTASKPRIVVKKRVLKNKKKNYLWGGVVHREKYVIYVPEGSINNSYKFNLE